LIQQHDKIDCSIPDDEISEGGDGLHLG